MSTLWRLLVCGWILAYATIGSVMAGVPIFEWDVDSQKPAYTWSIKTYAGATPLFRVNLKEGGTNWTPTVDWNGFFWYGTNSDWNATGIVQVVGIFTNVSYVDFQAISNTFPKTGTFYGGVVMTNSTQAIEWGRGYVQVYPSGGLSASGILDLRANVIEVSGGLLTKSGLVIGLTSNAVYQAVTNLGCITTNMMTGTGRFYMTQNAGGTSILYHVTSGEHTNKIGEFFTSP